MFSHADVFTYARWLEDYVRECGEITHYYPYPFRQWHFLSASKNFMLGGECGADARPIVGFPGVKWIGGELGHNNLYLRAKNGTPCHYGHCVPVFSDQVFLSVPGTVEKKKHRERENKRFEKERSKRERDMNNKAKMSDLSHYTQG